MNEVENLSPDHTHPPNMTIGEIINNKIKDLRRRKGKEVDQFARAKQAADR